MGAHSATSPFQRVTFDREAPESHSEKYGEPFSDFEEDLSSPRSQESPLERSGPRYKKPKRNDKGPMEIFCGWIVEHQIGLSVNLLVLLSLTHVCFPRARRHTRKFFELSYYNSETREYRAGWNDAWMVFYWVVVFTGLRAAVMDYALIGLAKKGGIRTKRDQIRFAEQAWLLIYYSIFWSLGMYILINSEYWLNFQNLWTDWPQREIDGLRKWYILVQYAFWLQQIMVINIEKRRKDHWQMFMHHIVTTMLIFTSYGYHQTRVANLILCVMDVVDIILPIAKCLKYLGYTTLCDFVFGIFMLVWFATRHVIYMMICWSLYSDLPSVTKLGCYKGKRGALIGPFSPPDQIGHLFEPFCDPEGIVCMNHNIRWGFLGALLFLQGITIIWFWMIVQVALRVLQGGQADDSRSDDEEDLDVPGIELEDTEPPSYEEIGPDSVSLKGRIPGTSSHKYIRNGAIGAISATGVSLPGHSDRKEYLGRIGCDKGA